MQTAFEGGCLCGGTRYRLGARPARLNDCHCLDCRRSSGAPFVTWGTVPRAKIALRQGSLREIAHAGRVRSWAACCGTHLFFADSADAGTVDIAIASLDDPTPFAPEMIIWTEDRLPWVQLDPRLPTYRRSTRET